MTFQDLKTDYQRQLDDSKFRAENKQRLNLSAKAYATLLNDIDAFRSADISVREGREIPSHVLNRIFRCFRETARSSIALALTNRRMELEKLLAAIQPDPARKKAIQLLLDDYQKQLVSEAMRRSEKGHAFSFRLDKNSMEYLAIGEGQHEGEFYDNNVGQYIKAVIEEYAELPYVERESIYHKEFRDEIQLGIAGGKMLKLALHSTKTVNGSVRSNLMYVKPVAIKRDSELLYNYLVGLTASSKEDPWSVGAIRLTKIKECRHLEQTASISGEKKKEIEDAIRKNGVQYLSASHVEKIVVQFTPEGERLYQQLLHLRPLFAANPKPLVYEFECTPFQAETYFFKYGHNTKILEPQSLATKFLRRYQSAARLYQNKD